MSLLRVYEVAQLVWRPGRKRSRFSEAEQELGVPAAREVAELHMCLLRWLPVLRATEAVLARGFSQNPSGIVGVTPAESSAYDFRILAEVHHAGDDRATPLGGVKDAERKTVDQ